jgi:hypothetical protein
MARAYDRLILFSFMPQDWICSGEVLENNMRSKKTIAPQFFHPLEKLAGEITNKKVVGESRLR